MRGTRFILATGAALALIAGAATVGGASSTAEDEAAFPGGKTLYVALPRQKFGEPLPDYGPALAKVFPDTPIVLLLGNWIQYEGPQAEGPQVVLVRSGKTCGVGQVVNN